MKKLSLTVFERLQLVGWLNRQEQGGLVHLRRALRVLDRLALSEEERAEVGYEQQEGLIRWRDVEREFEIELEDEDFAILEPAIKDRWPVNRDILRMLEKLNAEARLAV